MSFKPNFEVYQGDTVKESGTMYDSDNKVYDFTGSTVWMTVKLKGDMTADDSNALIKLYWKDGVSNHGISILNPTSGIIQILISATESGAAPVGEHLYDIRAMNGAGERETISSGLFTVKLPVTLRSSVP